MGSDGFTPLRNISKTAIQISKREKVFVALQSVVKKKNVSNVSRHLGTIFLFVLLGLDMAIKLN